MAPSIWAWRGDHGNGVGWTSNTADYGVVVNGDNVTAYGLFVEHYQKYQTVWNGENGTTIFYQSEMPYAEPSRLDVPDRQRLRLVQGGAVVDRHPDQLRRSAQADADDGQRQLRFSTRSMNAPSVRGSAVNRCVSVPADQRASKRRSPACTATR